MIKFETNIHVKCIGLYVFIFIIEELKGQSAIIWIIFIKIMKNNSSFLDFKLRK